MEQWPDVDDISYISRASEGREQTGPHVRSNAQMMIRGNCVHVHPPLRCMFPISHTSFGHPPLIRHKTPALSADSLLHSTSTTSTTSTTGVSSRVHTMSQTEQGGAPLKKRSVVSSFIIKYPDDADGSTAKPKVALFRRGDKVSTYRHHLAPISGSIESDDPSPLSAAWRELQEETTLTPDTLQLIRQGKSYSFQDLSIGREWTVYPFAYRLKAPESAIQIDWEHEGWGWYDPMEVEDTDAFGGVPRLAESLRRAWFEKDLGDAPGSAGALLAGGLAHLQSDFQSGARQMAAAALGTLRDVVRTLAVPAATPAPVDRWWTLVRLAAWHLGKNGRESMGAAIENALLDALQAMEPLVQKQGPTGDVAGLRAAAVAVVEQRLARRTAAASAQPITEALVQYLDKVDKSAPTLSILTLSESSTIAHFLRHFSTHPTRFSTLDLRVLESRPLFEGVSTAASLVRSIQGAQSAQGAQVAQVAQVGAADEPSTPKTRITLYSDASAALAAQDVDIVLLGADRIAGSGAVSNKIGSLPAVLCAKQPGSVAKVVVLGETDKIASPGDPQQHVMEDNDPSQLTGAWTDGSSSARVRSAAGAVLDTATASCSAGQSESRAPVQVQVRNVFFEWVPPELIDAYVTETGVWTVAEIRDRSKVVGEAKAKMFDSV